MPLPRLAKSVKIVYVVTTKGVAAIRTACPFGRPGDVVYGPLTKDSPMLLRPLAILAASSTVLAFGAAAEGPPQLDIGAAFQTTFGQPAPIARLIERPVYDIDQHKVVGHVSLEMELWPDRLVRVNEDRWALITKEINKNGAHSSQGAFAVSYLHRSESGWTLEQLWPEIVYSGSSGEPANVGEEVRQFGSAPLYLATGEYCGMGACSDDISAIKLAPSGPIDMGAVPGGGQFTAAEVSSDPGNFPCEDYAFTAVVGPPTTPRGIFSVTYEGWTAPPKARARKTRFHLKADAAPNGNGITLIPKIRVPACGR